MRMIFGILSLLLVVAVVGFLAKKQLRAVNDIKVPAISSPAAGDAPDATQVAPTGNAQQQAKQIQQQFKAAAEAAVQQARPLPDEK